nr:uncharacterized protein LOC104105858 isoform X2 [Nicotiana tomentosiformis]XP_033514491.1 uncharacterized protein LOC104105858 isoform X2 [Nicotiana tomentosiformis]
MGTPTTMAASKFFDLKKNLNRISAVLKELETTFSSLREEDSKLQREASLPLKIAIAMGTGWMPHNIIAKDENNNILAILMVNTRSVNLGQMPTTVMVGAIIQSCNARCLSLQLLARGSWSITRHIKIKFLTSWSLL